MGMPLDDCLAYAREAAAERSRSLTDNDVEFIEFLVRIGQTHRLSPAMLRNRVAWYLDHGPPSTGQR